MVCYEETISADDATQHDMVTLLFLLSLIKIQVFFLYISSGAELRCPSLMQRGGANATRLLPDVLISDPLSIAIAQGMAKYKTPYQTGKPAIFL